MPRLEVLHCHDNRIAALDPSAAPLLRELACGDNPFETMKLFPLITIISWDIMMHLAI